MEWLNSRQNIRKFVDHLKYLIYNAEWSYNRGIRDMFHGNNNSIAILDVTWAIFKKIAYIKIYKKNKKCY